MLDRLTFSWFVGTCNLGHPATGPQEALWNAVNLMDGVQTVKKELSVDTTFDPS
jgi:hypothetical protein